MITEKISTTEYLCTPDHLIRRQKKSFINKFFIFLSGNLVPFVYLYPPEKKNGSNVTFKYFIIIIKFFLPLYSTLN